jgi:hypothetical protein
MLQNCPICNLDLALVTNKDAYAFSRIAILLAVVASLTLLGTSTTVLRIITMWAMAETWNSAVTFHHRLARTTLSTKTATTTDQDHSRALLMFRMTTEIIWVDYMNSMCIVMIALVINLKVYSILMLSCDQTIRCVYPNCNHECNPMYFPTHALTAHARDKVQNLICPLCKFYDPVCFESFFVNVYVGVRLLIPR